MKSPNCTYYRNKADDIFMAQFRGKPCEICEKMEGSTGHHFIGKSRSKALRYDKRNVIILCQSHHTFSNVISPHSFNGLAVERFIQWFKETHPERYQWIVENEYIERKYTYKQAVENMKAGKEAWE